MIRILLAHQDQKLSEIYTEHLKTHFLVDSVYDGLSALRRFKVARPSIVVSDYHLPLLSGLSLLRFIRTNPEYSSTPFVFLSNHPDNTDALNSGANDWLDIKLCYPDFLLDRVLHHLKTNKYGLQIYRA